MEEKIKKERRVGTLTFGILLIVVGISVLLMTITGWEVLKYVLAFWPAALILLGGEILFFSFTQNERFRIDCVSIFLMCITLFLTSIFSVGNYAVNKVLYDPDIKSMLVNQMVANERDFYITGAVTVKTDGDARVEFLYVPTEEETAYAEIKPVYDCERESISRIIDFHEGFLYQMQRGNEFVITDLPEYVKQVYVTVYSSEEATHVVVE